MSLSGVPAGFDIANADCRTLGARIGAVALDGKYVPLDSPLLASGFHPIEQQGGELWRWTDGKGQIVMPAPLLKPVELELLVPDVMPSWKHVKQTNLRSSALAA